MTKLWELSSDLRDFEQLIDDIIESDLPEEQKQIRLDHTFSEWLTLDAEFELKAEAIAHYIKRLESLTEARKAEAKRIEQLAKQSESQANSLRSYLLTYMTRHNKHKIDGKTIKMSLRKKPPRVCLNCDVDQLPEQFQRVKVEANLTAIKDYLKQNPSCKFAFLSNGDDYSLMIK